MKGQHGFMIYYPSKKDKSDADISNDEEADLNFYIGTVFDISQTEEKSTY